MVCPEIQLSDTLGVSVSMCLGGCFWVRLTFESVDWGKQIDCLLQFGNASSNPWRVWREQEAGKGEFAVSAWASSSWDAGLILLLNSDWNLYHWFSWFLGLQTQTETIPSAFLGLQACQLQPLELPSLHHHVSQLLTINHKHTGKYIYIYIYIYIHTYPEGRTKLPLQIGVPPLLSLSASFFTSEAFFLLFGLHSQTSSLTWYQDVHQL